MPRRVAWWHASIRPVTDDILLRVHNSNCSPCRLVVCASLFRESCKTYNVCVIVVGNKADLIERRRVSHEDAQIMSAEHNVTFLEVWRLFAAVAAHELRCGCCFSAVVLRSSMFTCFRSLLHRAHQASAQSNTNVQKTFDLLARFVTMNYR